MKLLSKMLLSLCLISGLASCKSSASFNSAALQGKWTLSSINGESASSAFEKTLPTIEFNVDENRITGTGGCNRYNGSYTLENNKFSAPNTASTMMACIFANKESEFFKLLSNPSTLSVTNNNLTFNQNGKNVLVFSKNQPLTANDLSGEWHLQSLQGASANTYFNEKEPTINFDNEKVSGFSGCNRYNGGYTLENNQLTFTGMVSTRMACVDMEGENKFLKALSDDKMDVEIEDNMLILQKGGVEVMRFYRK